MKQYITLWVKSKIVGILVKLFAYIQRVSILDIMSVSNRTVVWITLVSDSINRKLSHIVLLSLVLFAFFDSGYLETIAHYTQARVLINYMRHWNSQPNSLSL